MNMVIKLINMLLDFHMKKVLFIIIKIECKQPYTYFRSYGTLVILLITIFITVLLILTIIFIIIRSVNKESINIKNKIQQNVENINL